MLSLSVFRRSFPRRGAVQRPIVILTASVVVLAALVLLLSRGNQQPAGLSVYCAAGLREPMEAIRKAYQTERGIPIVVQYGGSNTLLANLKLGQSADLFLPADDSYIEAAKPPHLLTESFPVARMRAVLAVKKHNPRSIMSLADLLNNNVRISMTDPATAASGKLVKAALESADKWNEFERHVTVFKGTVSEVAADLQVGAVDAGIIWDAMLKQLPELQEAPLAELRDATANVVIGVVASSKQQPAARALAQYIAAPDNGQRFFREAGFMPASSTQPVP